MGKKNDRTRDGWLAEKNLANHYFYKLKSAVAERTLQNALSDENDFKTEYAALQKTD